MKFLSPFMLIILCISYSFAQNYDQLPTDFDVVEIDADFKNADAIRHYKDNEERHYFIGLFDAVNSLKTIIVQTDSSFKIIKSIKREKALMGNVDFDYTFIKESKDAIEFYQYNPKSRLLEEYIQQLVLNKSSLVFFVQPYFNFQSNEKYSCTLSNANKSVIITTTSKKNQDSVIVYSIDNNSQIIRKAVDCTQLKIKDFKKRFSYMTVMGGFNLKQQRVKPNMENIIQLNSFHTNTNNPWIFYYRNSTNLDPESSKYKAYIGENQFYFLFDVEKEKCHTNLVTIDFDAQKSSLKKFYIDSTKHVFDTEYNLTSNLFDGKIFMGYANKEKFKFQIKDINTSEILKSWEVNDTDTISFKNTPLFKWERANTGGGFFKNTFKDSLTNLLKTEKFIKKLAEESFGIKITRTENDYELMIGALETVWSGGGSGMMMGSGGMMMAGGSTSRPIGYITYGFKSLLNVETLNHNAEKNVVIETAFQKLRNTANEYKNVDNTINFNDDGIDYFGYFDKKKKKFILTAEKQMK